MAQVCDICGKGPQFGNNISHAHNVTRRRWNVNLQAVKALVNGAPKRIRVCTSCIKSRQDRQGVSFSGGPSDLQVCTRDPVAGGRAPVLRSGRGFVAARSYDL